MRLLILLNQFLWSGPILVLLMGLHIYHSVRLGFVQRKIGYAIKLSLGEEAEVSDSKTKKHGFSRFGSLAATLAATLGTGNIIGVSTAVFLGGPGAVFWCWLTGVFGMATTYAETYLCTRFRYKDQAGAICSGPMYLLKHLLHRRGMAVLYSISLCISALFIGCTTQSNALTDTCRQVFGFSPVAVAVSAAFIVGVILIQGRDWIEKFSIAIVPTMAIYFFGSCLLYLILHAAYILPALGEIIRSAFTNSGIRGLGGGITGYTVATAMRYGVARGLFTNEAGLGTAGLIAGSSSEEKAEQQALISMSASFWDTVVLCAITGLVLVAFQLEYPDEWTLLSAGSLTTGAFSKLPFFGDKILAVAILCFAGATLVGWSYLGIQGFSYLFHGKGNWIYYVIYITMIFIGGILPLTLVWELTDFINLFLLVPSLYLLVKCRKFFHKT